MPETIKTKIVGVTKKNPDGVSRQEIIEKYLSSGDDLRLEREPDNPYDPNAIAVLFWPDEKFREGSNQTVTVGYLKSELASRLSPLMDQGYIIISSVLNVTGGEEGQDFGVNIALEIYTPEEVEEQKEIFKKSQAAPVSNAQITVPKSIQARPTTSGGFTAKRFLGLLLTLPITYYFFSRIFTGDNIPGDLGLTLLFAVISLVLLWPLFKKPLRS